MQSVPSIPVVHDEEYSIQHYVISLSFICGRSVVFIRILRFPLSNPIDCHDIDVVGNIAVNGAKNPILLGKIVFLKHYGTIKSLSRHSKQIHFLTIKY